MPAISVAGLLQVVIHVGASRRLTGRMDESRNWAILLGFSLGL